MTEYTKEQALQDCVNDMGRLGDLVKTERDPGLLASLLYQRASLRQEALALQAIQCRTTT